VLPDRLGGSRLESGLERRPAVAVGEGGFAVLGEELGLEEFESFPGRGEVPGADGWVSCS
jgi:hypothetical protein